MTNLKVGDKVFRGGELGIVVEVNSGDVETPTVTKGGVTYQDAPTGGIVIEWNELGANHAQRYAFAQIDELGIKAV